ncbi:heparan sulfate 2-O-sulfotransferase pipe-like isoform X2 [Eriocheir sinensis]|nr:heparan sulfate 2-O-sulfotransferase pipe-like isoform X2 [Eriocheir sinensis]XP_050702584.1 heparan sulfate 2-O-sulfotransferase pipe-like isoform X2 [Eriocheir sinensis]XP_050702585.1 heparan sulfate 2-O-sulfotransferase pipe-like isoform X2 [Eriocheir sinensis]
MEPFAYINFTRFGQSPPIHVAVIRDPVERAVSRFYQARAPFTLVERQQLFPGLKLPSRGFLKKDLETCLRSPRDPECKYPVGKPALGHTVEFFCGHNDYCPIFGDRAGLAAAMGGVESGWAVVGVLEEWNKTLAVMEGYVPRFFSGATQLYYEHIHPSKTRRNENFYRPSVEAEAVKFLRKGFELEYEFYEFVKQRLDHQYRALEGRRRR